MKKKIRAKIDDVKNSNKIEKINISKVSQCFSFINESPRSQSFSYSYNTVTTIAQMCASNHVNQSA